MADGVIYLDIDPETGLRRKHGEIEAIRNLHRIDDAQVDPHGRLSEILVVLNAHGGEAAEEHRIGNRRSRCQLSRWLNRLCARR